MNWRGKLPAAKLAMLCIGLMAATILLFALTFQQSSDLAARIYFPFGFAGLAFTLVVAVYFLISIGPGRPFPILAMVCCFLSLLSISLLLGLSETTIVKAILEIVVRRFQQPYWQAVGLALATAVFLPLSFKLLRRRRNRRSHHDLLAVGGLLLLVLLLYLPFGFTSIGQWESWIYLAFLRGQHDWNVLHEVVTRFWVAVPHLLASLVSSESFIGFHLVHLLIIWGKVALFYGILRQLRLAALFAFLVALISLVYPVNTALFSLRALPNQFSVMTLAGAVFLMLDYRQNPSRLHLLGMWLALTLNVVSQESGFVLILVMPLLWLWGKRTISWRDSNSTLIWYAAPAAKIAYMLLLVGSGMQFYNSSVFDGASTSSFGSASHLQNTLSRLTDVYLYAFRDGWIEAIDVLSHSPWLIPSAVALALAAAIAFFLARRTSTEELPAARQFAFALVIGLLMVIPSVGVLIWLEQYSDNLWRLSFYLPFGAAIVAFSLLGLLTAPIKRLSYRRAALTILCLIMILPNFVRLFAQHERTVISANNKAILLGNLMQLAPQINSDTTILLTADMTREELDATDFYEFQYSFNLDNSILYILYGDGVPVTSYFCLSAGICSIAGGEVTLFSVESPQDLLKRTLVIKLNEDLSVELLDDPASYFALGADIAYDATALYNPDAPLPPRASTMLGVALRD